ncbi:MAG: type II secretion system F family protein, partial [Patescibacteria group bacterium]
MLSQMMAVGESTGRLHEVLSKLTDFYSRELQNLVTNLVSAIEPLIMLVMGLAVGLMVAAIILPMYSLSSNF